MVFAKDGRRLNRCRSNPVSYSFRSGAIVRQQLKNAYFGVVRWASRPNYLAVRLRNTRRQVGPVCLNIGSGADYRAGFINIEANLFRRRDLWLDVRNGLPFPDDSAHLVYCSHMLEHLYPDEALELLREIRRVLDADGAARVAVPSFEHALEIAQGEAVSRFPRSLASPYAQAINYLFCDGQHKYAYSLELFREFAEIAGFTSATRCEVATRSKPVHYGSVRVDDEPEGSLVMELRAAKSVDSLRFSATAFP